MNDEEARYVRMFVNWLYVHGPDPDSMTREKLLSEYEAFLNADIERWDKLWRWSDPEKDTYEERTIGFENN
jgi:hypothetical protein